DARRPWAAGCGRQVLHGQSREDDQHDERPAAQRCQNCKTHYRDVSRPTCSSQNGRRLSARRKGRAPGSAGKGLEGERVRKPSRTEGGNVKSISIRIGTSLALAL